ncbi:hypothetical protein B0H13DRAFT_1873547 [Mycena leptocephala]|nr:hypothetical protein B0H13DRAFT_1873547 [Mycena leptocephala]
MLWMSQTEAKLLPPNLQSTQKREKEVETEMASSVLAEVYFVICPAFRHSAEVLAIRWIKKSSETKNVATQTSPPRRKRVNTEFMTSGCRETSSCATYGAGNILREPTGWSWMQGK